MEEFPNNCRKSYDKGEDAENDFRAFCTAQPLLSRGEIYAAFVDHKLGMYNSWYETKEHVDKFRNNSFRALKTREDTKKAIAKSASFSNQFI